MEGKMKVVYSSDAKKLSKEERKGLSFQSSFDVKKNGVISKRKSKVFIRTSSYDDYKLVEKSYEGIRVTTLPEELYEVFGFIKGALGRRLEFTEIILCSDSREVSLSVINDTPEPHELVVRYDYIENVEGSILDLVKRVVEFMAEKYGNTDRISIKSRSSKNVLKADLYKKDRYIGYYSERGTRELVVLLG